MEPEASRDVSGQPKLSRRVPIGVTIGLGIVGATLVALNLFFSYAIFFLVLFMGGLGGGTAEFIQKLTTIAGSIAIGFFVISVILVYLVLRRVYRHFQQKS